MIELAIRIQQAANTIHSFHWMTNGASFVGDHSLLDDIYSYLQESVDRFSELAQGLGEPPFDPNETTVGFQSSFDEEDIMSKTLEVITQLKQETDTHEEEDKGWQNAIGDFSENLLRFVYKLRRRLKT
jgi:DNA-binding ferritin-like protein